MMHMKHTLLLILFSTLWTFNYAAKKKKMVSVVRIVKFSECPEYEYPQVKLTYIKLENLGRGTQVLHLNMSVLSDLPEELKISGTGYKCTTIADQSCELLLRGTVDGCRTFMDKGKFYSKLFDYKPSLKCPIKKGEYILRNATYIGSELERFVKFVPPENYQYYWSVRVKIFDAKPPHRIVHCAENMFKVTKIKEK